MNILARLALVTALAAFGPITASAETIAPAQAVTAVGQHATVVGVASQVSTDSRSGNIFINFGGRYPNHVFYAVIFDEDAHRFGSLRSLQGQILAITGSIEIYRGKPQIVVRDPGQIEIR